MSVLKSKRKASQFEVFNHFYKMRKEITDLLLRDFGYDLERAENKAMKIFGDKTYEELHPKKKPDMKSSWRKTKPLMNGSL